MIVPDTGSGYGGKHTGEAAIEAARLAKAAGKPVKLVWTREEEFTWAYFRPAGVIEVQGGARQDGTLDAPGSSTTTTPAARRSRTPYEVAATRRSSSTRSSRRCARARTAPWPSTANHFARESHMDELAHAVGMDPLAFRLKNLKDERLRAVLEAAAERFGWGRTKAAAGPRLRHRRRHREGRLRRHLRRGRGRTREPAA